MFSQNLAGGFQFDDDSVVHDDVGLVFANYPIAVIYGNAFLLFGLQAQLS